MARIPDATFEGYNIYTLAVPTDNGRWSATSEIERHGAPGSEIFQAFGGPFLGNTEEAAKADACNDAKHKITDIVARPV